MATLGVHWVDFFFLSVKPQNDHVRLENSPSSTSFIIIFMVVSRKLAKFQVWVNCPFKAVPDFIILQFEAVFCDLGEKKIPSRSVSMDWPAANKVGGVQMTSFPHRCFPNKRGGEVLLADDVSETFDCSLLYTCVLFFSCHDALQL